MNYAKKYHQNVFVRAFICLPSIFIAVMLSGCGGQKSAPSGGGGDNTDPGYESGNSHPGGYENTIGKVDTTGFWVAAVALDDDYPVVTRKSTAFTDFCQIPAGTNDTVINCIVDVEENNLNLQGLKLQYNVPPDMCDYLVRDTYWYYDQSVGTGPSSVVVRRTFDADDEFVSATCSIDGAPAGACTDSAHANNIELDFDTIDGSVADITCRYECCTGEYTHTIIDDHTAAGNEVEEQTTLSKWGENFGACVGGAGKSSWSHYSTNGIPIGIWTRVLSGINDAHTLKAPNLAKRNSNYELANFYTPAVHLHSGYVSPLTSQLPYAVDPIDDLNGTLIYPGNEAYSFYCLDRAREVRNIINVYVRDWDTLAEFEDYIDSEGASGNPDLGALPEDGVNCDGILGFCNDYYDWDDLLNISLSGVYDIDLLLPALRDTFFPNEDDED